MDMHHFKIQLRYTAEIPEEIVEISTSIPYIKNIYYFYIYFDKIYYNSNNSSSNIASFRPYIFQNQIFFSLGYLFIFFITSQIFSYKHIILRFWHSDDQYLYFPNFSRGNVGALWVSQVALVVKHLPPKARHIRDEGSISGLGRSS